MCLFIMRKNQRPQIEILCGSYRRNPEKIIRKLASNSDVCRIISMQAFTQAMSRMTESALTNYCMKHGKTVFEK